MISNTRQFFIDKLQRNNGKAYDVYNKIVKDTNEKKSFFLNVDYIYLAGCSMKSMREVLRDLSQYALIDYYEKENGFVTMLTKV